MESNNGVAVTNQQKNITDNVLVRITHFQETGQLMLPKNYSPENALKSAYLILVDQKDRNNKPVLESCTKESIANSLLKMVTEGLSVAKHQGSFIPYDGKLSWQREYAGNIALARRVAGLKKIKANPIFEGDIFEYEINHETGRRKLTKHVQTLESLGGMKIKGAYAIYELEDGSMDMEVMTFQQIQSAWQQGAAKGNSPAHRNFPDQMSAKTVINRACKLLINSSDDSHLYVDAEIQDAVSDDVKEKINGRANKVPLQIDETEPNVQLASTIKEPAMVEVGESELEESENPI